MNSSCAYGYNGGEGGGRGGGGWIRKAKIKNKVY